MGRVGTGCVAGAATRFLFLVAPSPMRGAGGEVRAETIKNLMKPGYGRRFFRKIRRAARDANSPVQILRLTRHSVCSVDKATMKLTPFGFVALAETFFQDALSSPPLGGGSWGFQRSANFNDHTGALQVLLSTPAGPQKTKISLHARLTGSARDYSIQGWTDRNDGGERDAFVLRETDFTRAQEEVFEIVERLLQHLPERDASAPISRPAPVLPPKAPFAPLIPEIQSRPEGPLDAVEPAPAEIEPAATTGPSANPADFASTQDFVDSLLSPAGFDEPTTPPVEEIAPVTAEEPVAEAPSTTVKTPPKASKTAKPSKKAAK